MLSVRISRGGLLLRGGAAKAATVGPALKVSKAGPIVGAMKLFVLELRATFGDITIYADVY